MSAKQLSAFFEAVKADAGLKEKLKAAGDLDAAVAIAVEAGFDMNMADWLKAQARQVLEMSDEELAGVAGGALLLGWIMGAKAEAGYPIIFGQT